MRQSPLNPIPEDTRQAALSLYSVCQPYLLIGDQVSSVYKDLNLADLSTAIGDPEEDIILLALITLFQYAERLSDQQVTRATSQRIDWKYALHLPMAYPGIAPSVLCSFRQKIRLSVISDSLFQILMERCKSLGLVLSDMNSLPELSEILEVNCLKTNLDLSMNLFIPAVEVLAADESAWLKRIAMPHWYSRYMVPYRSLFQAYSREELSEAIFNLQKDIGYLRRAIYGQKIKGLTKYPEIQKLFMSLLDDKLLNQQIINGANIQGVYVDCSTCVSNQYAQSVLAQ